MAFLDAQSFMFFFHWYEAGGWVLFDGTIFLAIFIGLTRSVLEGAIKGRGAKPLYTALGIALAAGLLFAEYSSHVNLLVFGPVSAVILSMVLGYFVFSLVNKTGSWWAGLIAGILAASLVLLSMWSGMLTSFPTHPFFAGIGLGIAFLMWLLQLAMILAGVGLALWLVLSLIGFVGGRGAVAAAAPPVAPGVPPAAPPRAPPVVPPAVPAAGPIPPAIPPAAPGAPPPAAGAAPVPAPGRLFLTQERQRRHFERFFADRLVRIHTSLRDFHTTADAILFLHQTPPLLPVTRPPVLDQLLALRRHEDIERVIVLELEPQRTLYAPLVTPGISRYAERAGVLTNLTEYVGRASGKWIVIPRNRRDLIDPAETERILTTYLTLLARDTDQIEEILRLIGLAGAP